jgi:hypothetical protein
LPVGVAPCLFPPVAGPFGVLGEDFRELPAYHCYAQLVAESAPQPWASAETSPAPLALRGANEVRHASTATYGALRSAVEAELEALLSVTGVELITTISVLSDAN